jgi:hypothetical protein
MGVYESPDYSFLFVSDIGLNFKYTCSGKQLKFTTTTNNLILLNVRSGNATMRSTFIIDKHVNVNYVKILSVPQK